MKRLTIIAAAARNWTIGSGNGLPWKMPSDLKRFRKVTMGKAVILGRKTMESIGKPLPGRHCIVLSRRSDFVMPGVQIAQSVDEAIRFAQREGDPEEAMVIGGEEIYRLFFPLVDRIILTVIDGDYNGDAVFPAEEIRAQNFEPNLVEDHPAVNGDERPCSVYHLARVDTNPALVWRGEVKPASTSHSPLVKHSVGGLAVGASV